MSLTQRKPRPLRREPGRQWDTRLFIVACDDTHAPKQYFDQFSISRIQVHVVETPAGEGTSAPRHVLSRLEAVEYEEDDERWLLLDTDHHIGVNHIGNFRQVLQEARQKNIRVALSHPCFEFWLLLHIADATAASAAKTPKEVIAELSARIEGYNKANIRAERFAPFAVDAHARAARLDAQVAGGDIPASPTSRVYQLLDALIADTPEWRLPEPLRLIRKTRTAPPQP